MHLRARRDLRDLNFDSNCCFQPIPQSVEQSKTNWEGGCNFFPYTELVSHKHCPDENNGETIVKYEDYRKI